MAAARPQLDEEEAEAEAEGEEEAAEELPPAEGEAEAEAAAPEGEAGAEAAPAAEGGQMGEVECFAAEKCLGTYNQDKVSAQGLCLPDLALSPLPSPPSCPLPSGSPLAPLALDASLCALPCLLLSLHLCLPRPSALSASRSPLLVAVPGFCGHKVVDREASAKAYTRHV